MRLNQELERANREKDKLMSIIAHELRNPLYWFQNLTQSLSVRFREMPPEKAEKTLRALDESAKNTFHLMNNLLYWSRSRLNRITVKKEVINLKKLVETSTQIFSSIIEQKEISLRVNVDDAIILTTDADLISCVIRNLVSNALKFTSQNGSITIDTAKLEGFIQISVTDNGIGINHQISSGGGFDSMQFPESGMLNEKGSGLGLKLCNEFVMMCGGSFHIDENFENGSRLFFFLPAYD